MGKLYRSDRVHKDQVKQTGAVRKVLAHAQLRTKDEASQGEPRP